MLINRDKLLGCLKEYHYTQSNYAERLKLTPTGFKNKLKGRDFKEAEIERMIEDFGIQIFLTKPVAK